jgi:hypothetical protein
MTTIVIIVLSLITARLVLVQFLPWCAYLVFCAWLVKRTDDPKALDHAASAAKAYPLRPLLWHRNDQPRRIWFVPANTWRIAPLGRPFAAKCQ